MAVSFINKEKRLKSYNSLLIALWSIYWISNGN